MVDMLPSPTGGANPWGAALQVHPKPGLSPIIQELMTRRSDSIKAGHNLSNTIAGQLGNIGAQAGGMSMLDTLQHLQPGLNPSRTFSAMNDPARVRATHAAATQAIGTAMNQGAQAGIGMSVREDGSIADGGPMTDPQLSNVKAIKGASAPRTYNTTTTDTGGLKTTVKMMVPVRDANGHQTLQEVTTTLDQVQKIQQKYPGAYMSSGAGQQMQLPQVTPTPQAPGQGQNMTQEQMAQFFYMLQQFMNARGQVQGQGNTLPNVTPPNYVQQQ